MIITDLVDLGLARAIAIVAIAVVALLRLRRRWRVGGATKAPAQGRIEV
jgi:hypothetical protein